MKQNADDLRRLEALRLAAAEQHRMTPEQIVKVAAVYFQFLKGDSK